MKEIKDLSPTSPKLYDNPWMYEGKAFTSEDIGDHVGFIYEIHDTITGQKYIGKKQFTNKKTRPPLKGKKRRRIEHVESDWKTYYGSNELLAEAVKGSEDKSYYKRYIIRLCNSKSELSYYETKEIFVRDAILRDDYYNSWATVKVSRNQLGNLKISLDP